VFTKGSPEQEELHSDIASPCSNNLGRYTIE